MFTFKFIFLVEQIDNSHSESSIFFSRHSRPSDQNNSIYEPEPEAKIINSSLKKNINEKLVESKFYIIRVI